MEQKEIYGYAIEYKAPYQPYWSRYWNHKLYRNEKIVNEAISSLEKVSYFHDWEFKSIPLTLQQTP
jgi:hypothetical protein